MYASILKGLAAPLAPTKNTHEAIVKLNNKDTATNFQTQTAQELTDGKEFFSAPILQAQGSLLREKRDYHFCQKFPSRERGKHLIYKNFAQIYPNFFHIYQVTAPLISADLITQLFGPPLFSADIARIE